MIIHWSLSDSNSPQVSRTLRSILVDLNNTVVWMVSTHPLISQSSSLCINPLVTVPRAQITNGITVTFMFHSFFSIPKQSRSTYPSFRILLILLCGPLGQQCPQFWKFSFFFFVDYYKVWSSGWDQVIRLYLQIPEKCVRLILQDRFWVVHIPFVRMVNSQ